MVQLPAALSSGQGFIERERREGVRMIYEGPEAVAFMPVCARYAYEVWAAPLRPASSFTDLTTSERHDFARALKTVLMKFDRLWNRPFPYILAFHQAPTDGQPHPEAHLHAELYPALRMPDRLKYLAGSENSHEYGVEGVSAITVDSNTKR